jgi:hypothetical protein
MNRFYIPSPPALYCLGGRLYKSIGLSPTSVHLEDLLDGQLLLFTQDEARQMLQQQDLIEVMPSALRRLAQTDPRYRRHLPVCERWNGPEPRPVSPDQRAKAAQWLSLIPHATPADAGPRRKAAAERRDRCTRFFSGTDDDLTYRPGGPRGAGVQVILVDEFSNHVLAGALAQMQLLAWLQARTQTPGPDDGGIRAFTGYPRLVDDRPMSEGRGRSMPPTRAVQTPPGGRLKSSVLLFSTTTRLTAAPVAVARPRVAQPDQRTAGRASTSVSGAAVDLTASPPAPPGSRFPLSIAGGTHDVE